MGIFKDMRKLQKQAKQFERPSLRDGLKQASEMVQQATESQQLAQELVNSGVDAQATINGVRATGKNVNYQPEMELDLTVNVGGATSDLTHTQVISPAVIGQLQPGATVPVKVDPNDHSRLMIGLG